MILGGNETEYNESQRDEITRHNDCFFPNLVWENHKQQQH